ncbi:hypothetical protein C0581_03355 [Candidatus Parcubacteria bacterium]|nr:MAG: hypothetical protein C0581_03355 [Candidatus Parcubacteria bacterium]
MENQYTPFYRTGDFNEALVLDSAGIILANVEWDYRGEVGTFVFEDYEASRQVLDKHKRKDLWLLSQDVLSSYSNIKSELYRNR